MQENGPKAEKEKPGEIGLCKTTRGPIIEKSCQMTALRFQIGEGRGGGGGGGGGGHHKFPISLRSSNCVWWT